MLPRNVSAGRFLPELYTVQTYTLMHPWQPVMWGDWFSFTNSLAPVCQCNPDSNSHGCLIPKEKKILV
jgi:hypothetical protein